MRHRQTLRIALMALAVLGIFPGTSYADSAPVPEPGTLALVASGFATLGGIRWLRRRLKKK